MQYKKNTLVNIYYTWKQKAKIFSWYSIFDNILTEDNNPYLKDVQNKFIYNIRKDNMYWHRHILWMSNYHNNPIFYQILKKF